MILLKFIPVDAPIVNGEGLYAVQWSQDRSTYKDLEFKVRAKNTACAEEKVLYCFTRELKGKTLDFNLTEMVKQQASMECESIGGKSAPDSKNKGDNHV